MNTNELRLLADHMGHDINVHASHYSLQSSLLERTKVAKVLTAIELGSVAKLTEKTNIEEILVTDGDVCQLGLSLSTEPFQFVAFTDFKILLSYNFGEIKLPLSAFKHIDY